MPLKTGNRFVDMSSHLQTMYNLLETDEKLLNAFDESLQKVVSQFQLRIHESSGDHVDRQGEFVSVYPSVDHRHTYDRKRSSFEPTRKRQAKETYGTNTTLDPNSSSL